MIIMTQIDEIIDLAEELMKQHQEDIHCFIEEIDETLKIIRNLKKIRAELEMVRAELEMENHP